MELFGKLSADDFFQNYWQRKPCLFKDGLSGFNSPLDADELAGLACEEDIESRLVLEKGGDKPWQAVSGPFSEETLRNLPDSNWSLSVQGVERVVPEVSHLLRHFKFLPNWLLDDILVSYAPDAGSVGAHIDNYDVFIIQGQGKRRWLLGGAPQWNEEYQEGLDIRLLKHFEPEHEWELESGDVLYIPMRFAHHGIALGECLNYSVGFRAPTDAELIRSLCTWCLENEVSDKFFRDSTLKLQSSPGEITAETLSAVKEHMKSFIDSEKFGQWFAEYITEPKAFFVPREENARLTTDALCERVQAGALLIPIEGLKRSWIDSDSPVLFIEGERISFPSDVSQELVRLICDSEEITAEQISAPGGSLGEVYLLLSELLNKGFFDLIDPPCCP